MQGVVLEEMRQYVAQRFGYRPWIETLRRSGHTVRVDLVQLELIGHWTYPEFLVHMEPLLHQAMQLHKPGANKLRIQATPVASDSVTLTYDSPLRACATVEGVILGAAKEYGVRVEVAQDRCALRGDPICSFSIRIAPAGPQISTAS